ncbi:MAG: hypothetical protein ACE5E0_06315 [Terriglobia bacterium]
MEDRQRRQKDYFRKRTRVSPRAYVLLGLLGLLVIYLIVGSVTGGNRAVTRYFDKTNDLIRQSNKQADGFESLKKNVANVSRTELKDKLKEYADGSKQLAEEAAALKAPEQAARMNVYLEVTLALRAKGLKDYSPALFNALKDDDLEVASAQVGKALKNLTLSDQAYESFRVEAKEVVAQEGLNVKVPDSRFLKDASADESLEIIGYLQNVKGIKSLEEAHGLNLTKLAVVPKQSNFLKSRRLAVLPSSSDLRASVVVQNQGNQVEFNVPVVATLKSSEKVKAQKEEIRVLSINPGENKTVTFSKLRPAQQGVTNLLTVIAGPVPKEKNTKNNSTEFKFMMSESSD